MRFVQPYVRKIPWIEAPGRLKSMGSQRVRHKWATSLSFLRWGSGNEKLKTQRLASLWLAEHPVPICLGLLSYPLPAKLGKCIKTIPSPLRQAVYSERECNKLIHGNGGGVSCKSSRPAHIRPVLTSSVKFCWVSQDSMSPFCFFPRSIPTQTAFGNDVLCQFPNPKTLQQIILK